MKKMTFFRFSLSCLAAASLLASTTLQASEHEEEGGHGEHHKKNAIGLFIGGTDAGGREFTVGLEYERRLTKLFGIGGVIEYTKKGERGREREIEVEGEEVSILEKADGVATFVGLVHVHPIWGLRLSAGGGFEQAREEDDQGLWRLGAAYDFEIGNDFAIAPGYAVDWINGKRNYVYGVTLSRHF